MSEPRKHHYVPVCYLRQWAKTDDRRLCEHKLIPGGYGVKPRRTSPDGTGYQVDLYRVDGVPDDIAQDFEKRFMHLVDTDAARALEKIIAGETDNWPGDLRSGFTRFIAIPRRSRPSKTTSLRCGTRGPRLYRPTTSRFLAKHEPNAAQIGAFIQKHFGKLPDHEILTDQQRQEAIEAAQGKRKEAA